MICAPGIAVANYCLLPDARMTSDIIPFLDTGDYMKKISCLLSLLLILAPIVQVAAQSQANLEKARKNVAKLGVGSKAKATITLNDGGKVKGYVYSAGDDDFVIRNRDTDAPTTIRYADVKNVDDNRGHRNAKLAVLFVGIGAAVTLAAVFGAIAANER